MRGAPATPENCSTDTDLPDPSICVTAIADQSPAEVASRQSEEQYRLLFECNPVPMWVFDRDTFRFVAVNEAAIRKYGFTEKEFLEKQITEIRPEEDIPELLEDVARRTLGLEDCGLWRHRKKSGELIDVEIVSHPLDFRGVPSLLVAAHDVTERKRAEDAVRQAEEKYRDIFENAVIGIFQTAPGGRLININRALAQMHGYDSPEEFLADVTNVPQQLFVRPGQMIDFLRKIRRDGIVRGAELEVYRKDRTRKWVRLNLRAVRGPSGEVVSQEGTVEDITERKVAEARAQFLAYYDALTELPQRALLQDRLDNALAGARRRGERIALLFLDLDRFKAVNDSYGRSFGDCVLKDVASRLKDCAQEHNTVARLGGDEFLILLSNIKDSADVSITAEQILEAMSRPFNIQGRSLSLGCSVGISIFPEHGEDGETLIRNADAAMHSAKESGRSTMRFFTGEMNAQAVERLTMDKNLRLALDRKELFLEYQPQTEIETGRITGFEVLLRWRHPELGLILPHRFISIAENNGLILAIGEWVLETACAEVRRWQNNDLPVVPVAVNVSAVQFRQEKFCKVIRRVLQKTGLAPELLELELTESLLLSNADVTLSVLRELKEMGLKLCIDDFGTGYSSLSYLRHFSVDKLKIDQSFIRDIVANRDDAAITTAIINMAKSLHIKVVAEGVEEEAQVRFLRDRQCDEIQGHYCSKPVSAEEAGSMLRCEQRHRIPGHGFRSRSWL
jgi:diguanylate cyclase (GGDEF)-like protein/PAS domain S-box-containing protein